MISRFVDTHSHLHFPAYGSEQESVYLRMRQANVSTICVGTSAHTSRSAIAFAEAHEGIYASVGYHPEHLTSSFHDEAEGPIETFDIVELEHLATSSSKVVAIGETGLDFFRIDDDRDRALAIEQQEAAFRAHFQLARKLHKPVIIHCREALTRLAELLKEEQEKGRVDVVVHCFTGTWAEAEPLLQLGAFLSFTGITTFPAKKTADPELSVHRVIERMPVEKLLIETDAPWLAPIPYRGKQNEPAYVIEVAKKIAELRDMTLEEVAMHTTKNASQLFQL